MAGYLAPLPAALPTLPLPLPMWLAVLPVVTPPGLGSALRYLHTGEAGLVGAGEGLHGEGVVLVIIISVTVSKIDSVNGMFNIGKIICKVHVGVELSIFINIVLTNPCHSQFLFLRVELTIVPEDIRETDVNVRFI